MASSSVRWQQTVRDRQILAALDLCPMESKDLLLFSQIFSQPFTSLDRTRKTLKRLAAARQVRSWRYATTGEGGGAAPLYYKLTLDGYRTLHQSEIAMPPTKRYLSEIGPGRHRHQQNLTNYIVKTHVAAHERNLPIVDSYAENTFRIETPLGLLFPDHRYTLVLPGGRRFTYCVELDNSTESIWSQKESDSIEMKLRKYLHDFKESAQRYRVQFIVTGAPERAKHILEAAKRLQAGSDFSPFYVTRLDDYVGADDPFLTPVFTAPKCGCVSLLRAQAEQLSKKLDVARPTLAQPLAAC